MDVSAEKAKVVDGTASLVRAVQEAGGVFSDEMLDMSVRRFIAEIAGQNNIRFRYEKPTPVDYAPSEVPGPSESEFKAGTCRDCEDYQTVNCSSAAAIAAGRIDRCSGFRRKKCSPLFPFCVNCTYYTEARGCERHILRTVIPDKCERFQERILEEAAVDKSKVPGPPDPPRPEKPREVG